MMKKRKHSSLVSKANGISVERSEKENHFEAVIIPDSQDSGESDVSDDNSTHSEVENNSSSEEEDNDECHMIHQFESYFKIIEKYDTTQKKLENDHVYKWIDGEAKYDENLVNNILLSETEKTRIKTSSPIELFEMFFSTSLKNYIIEATAEHGYELKLQRLNTFLGIIIFTIFNKRLSQRDYWSQRSMLRSDAVTSAMGLREFEKIKQSIRYHKSKDEKADDKIWRVRRIMEIFNTNIKCFGFFCTALCIDEMMLKYYGKISFKQFIQSKPIRFGIKKWALCSSNGYLFHCEIYCGKNVKVNMLNNCAQGSRVVMQMLHDFLSQTSPRNKTQYHIYFDNLFCSPDLLVHLKKLNLKATGTVRKNRLQVSNDIDVKSPRGTFAVKRDINSGINFITVVDSKQISILSTAAGITPVGNVKRYNKDKKEKVTLPFPNAFKVYNNLMGGVDLHDQHCNKLMPIIRSKKWTWIIFIRLLQASITNATILYNVANEHKKKIGSKEFAIEISSHYLKTYKNHTLETRHVKKRCSRENCFVRSTKFCNECEAYFCLVCFNQIHITE